MAITKKKRGYGLELKTIDGKSGTYLFFRAKNGDYHAFLEVEAKDAARECGAQSEGTTQQMCKEVWDNN